MAFNIKDLMNGVSRANLDTLENNDNTVQDTILIDVEKLIESEDNFYKVEPNIAELANSIELLGGIQQNLVVEELQDGNYKVIAGHRRRKAVLHLLEAGKEDFRMVPCKVRKASDGTLNDLALILTNSTARILSDYEKMKQASVLKNLLNKYREQIEEENKGKPEEEKIYLGRTRTLVAEMMNLSESKVKRLEQVNNGLSDDFKEELKEGKINISTAVKISSRSEEEQKELYDGYQQSGEIHIKDIKITVDRNVDGVEEVEPATENSETPDNVVDEEPVETPTETGCDQRAEGETLAEGLDAEVDEEEEYTGAWSWAEGQGRMSFEHFTRERDGCSYVAAVDNIIANAISTNQVQSEYGGRKIDEFGIRKDLTRNLMRWIREETEQYSLYLNWYYGRNDSTNEIQMKMAGVRALLDKIDDIPEDKQITVNDIVKASEKAYDEIAKGR